MVSFCINPAILSFNPFPLYDLTKLIYGLFPVLDGL